MWVRIALVLGLYPIGRHVDLVGSYVVTCSFMCHSFTLFVSRVELMSRVRGKVLTAVSNLRSMT